MGHSAPVERGGQGKGGKGDQKDDDSSSVAPSNEWQGGPEPLPEQGESHAVGDNLSLTNFGFK